jgi:hypothetical protein
LTWGGGILLLLLLLWLVFEPLLLCLPERDRN